MIEAYVVTKNLLGLDLYGVNLCWVMKRLKVELIVGRLKWFEMM
jgi:hypothetical protein